ncbi:MAG: RnfABCDGE type electron transport complex subunit D, partial [Woeseiaceae bacterium]
MKQKDPELLLVHAPLLRQGMTTPKAMRDVIYALLPATAASLWFFGLSAVLVLGASIAGAVLAEVLFAKSEARGATLRDATGLLTGLLLGLSLPAGLPMWMAFLGGFVAISFGKIIWGGLGHNLFNPALVGRAFLLAAFPIAMTTWVSAGGQGGFMNVYD